MIEAIAIPVNTQYFQKTLEMIESIKLMAIIVDAIVISLSMYVFLVYVSNMYKFFLGKKARIINEVIFDHFNFPIQKYLITKTH